jgi:hypothetical protein
MEFDSTAVCPSLRTTAYKGVQDAVYHVKGEWLNGVTTDQEIHEGLSFMWPSGSRLEVNMTGLPAVGSLEEHQLRVAILAYFETSKEIEGTRYIELPVHHILVDAANKKIIIFADQARMYMMRPMPPASV